MSPNPDIPLKYIDFVYFTLVTSYTIGYGDIYPNKFISRTLVISVLLFTFSIIGANISAITVAFKESNKYDKYYRLSDHFVIFGVTNQRDIIRLLMTMIDRWGFEKMPKVLIIGDKRI
jgi:hypothetical protein